jgi:hypothetical protein
VQNAALSIENYMLETELRKDRTDTGNGIGGGLLVYSRAGLKILPHDKHGGSSFNQFCAFTIATTGRKLNIILAYRPPSSDQTNTAELCEILRNLEADSILVGDINLPGIIGRTRKGAPEHSS